MMSEQEASEEVPVAADAAVAPPEAEGDEDKLFKVLVIGDYGVGKTSIIQKYTTGSFSPDYKLSIGVDFSTKTLDMDGEKVKLQLWDIAGHERFNHMTRVYYKYAIAAIVVCDLGRPATLESAGNWLNDVNEKVVLANGDPVPVVLLANKCDSYDEGSYQTIEAFCKDRGFRSWFPTSAKTGKNISESVDFLAKEILRVAADNYPRPDEEGTKLVSNAPAVGKPMTLDEFKSKCCA